MFAQTLKQHPVKLAIQAFTLALILAAAITSTQAAALGKARFSWEPVSNASVTGYKVHWGTQSGVYTHSVDAGNSTDLVIQQFAEGVQYFSAITAYSATGEESDYSTELIFTYDSVDRMILLEAENAAITEPMQISGDGTISWISANTPDPAATATIAFSVPYSSDFYVWCRVLAPTNTQDSFLVTVDQQPEHIYDVYGQTSPPIESFQPDWIWSRIELSPGMARAYSLETGNHTLQFRYREDVKLDRIVIVSNSEFVPTDALPRSGDFVEVLTHPQTTSLPAGTSTTLTASFVSTGPISLQWHHDGSPIPNSSLPNLDLADLKASDSGQYHVSASRGSASAITSPATLTVLPATGNEVFRVRNMSVTGEGQVTFEFAGAVGSEIGVFASTDLVHWTLLSTQPNTGNTITVNDPGAAGAPQRFYRLSDTVAQ